MGQTVARRPREEAQLRRREALAGLAAVACVVRCAR